MSVVLYCGDPHGEFRHIIRAAEELKASAVVLLGDLEPQRPLHEELEPIADKVWFIHGNHDTDSDSTWSNVWESGLVERNIHGRVVTLPDGTRLAGLGGVFRGAVWYPHLPEGPRFRTAEEHDVATPRWDQWREGRPRKHWSSIYPDELDRLADLRADVLITHEAPGYHRNGFGFSTPSLNRWARTSRFTVTTMTAWIRPAVGDSKGSRATAWACAASPPSIAMESRQSSCLVN